MFVGGCSHVFVSELVSSNEGRFWRGMRRKHTCSLYPVVRGSVCFEVRPLTSLKLQILGEGELPNQGLESGVLAHSADSLCGWVCLLCLSAVPV